MKTNNKKLKDHTFKELYSYLEDNENIDGGMLGCICSEILRRFIHLGNYEEIIKKEK